MNIYFRLETCVVQKFPYIKPALLYYLDNYSITAMMGLTIVYLCK